MKRFQLANYDCLIIKYSKDNRYDISSIATHDKYNLFPHSLVILCLWSHIIFTYWFSLVWAVNALYDIVWYVQIKKILFVSCCNFVGQMFSIFLCDHLNFQTNSRSICIVNVITLYKLLVSCNFKGMFSTLISNKFDVDLCVTYLNSQTRWRSICCVNQITPLEFHALCKFTGINSTLPIHLTIMVTSYAYIKDLINISWIYLMAIFRVRSCSDVQPLTLGEIPFVYQFAMMK